MAVLAAPLAAEGQQVGQVARIGWLGTQAAGGPHLLAAFRQGLQELGYVQGRNIQIEYRYSGGKSVQLPALAAELVALKVDVIVAANTPAAQAARRATKAIPIVCPAFPDPVATGLVASFARPGGNVTGLSFFGPELVGKRMELLKQAMPRISRVAVLLVPTDVAEGQGETTLKAAEEAARTLGVRLQVVEARGPGDIDRAFSDMTRERAEALTVLGGRLLFEERRRVVDLAAKTRLPAAYGSREYVEVGGLMAYGPNIQDLFRRAATYVDKILKGAKPADLPVEQPTKFELMINLKTARALGLTIPPSVLGRADQVIE
jgi:ABC-type uncharacterized transport system substrate-binding protein